MKTAAFKQAEKIVDDDLRRSVRIDIARMARNILYDAYETEDPAVLVRAARKALKIYPDCTEAFNVHGQYSTKKPEKALAYYQQAVESAERDLGAGFRSKCKGGFWGKMETRPFMRAMAGAGMFLWDLNYRDEAVDIFEEMLTLNPNDNQGIRYVLVNKLMILDRLNEAERLMKKYGHEFEANFLYSRALILFHKKEKIVQAKKALIKAFNYNPYVAFFLFGRRPMPGHEPHYVGMGDENEAIAYLGHASEVWKRDVDAAEWAHSLFLPMKAALAEVLMGKKGPAARVD